MPKIITEDMIEQAAIKALQERHDYTVLNCMTEELDTLPDGTGRKDKNQGCSAGCDVRELMPDQSRYSGTDRSHGGWTSCVILLFLEI